MFMFESAAFKRSSQRLAVNLLAVFVLFGASGTVLAEPQLLSIEGRTMGTSYHIKWVSDESTDNSQQLKIAADKLLIEINQAMSTYIADSELSKFNQLASGSKVQVSAALYQVLTLAQQISRDSKGAYDITVGPLINLWGFGPDKRVTKAPSEAQIAAIRPRVGYQHLVLLADNYIQKNAQLYVDLSSIAKGFAVDQLAKLMDSYAYSAYLVEIGGELITKGLKPGEQPWRIAIESPVTGRVVQRVVRVDDIAVATSGDYRNYFEDAGTRYSHIINTVTGRPITHNLASVTVLADNCALADALATTFLAMGKEKAYQYALAHNIDAFFISKSAQGFTELMTPGFTARIVK
ncbi:MAG: FAD:protein FMN transferase [Oceanospirillaceae bacterium]|nr:FAD:protein FMN transferase [Oceanospirillaceae bacterium]